VLLVTDTGVGMPPDVQHRIFEPFFTTKERGKGTGLGLSTVYGIVKQSGGEVLVTSELGQGTTFKILLPLAEGAPEEKAEVPRPEESGGNETILVAEDESAVRTLIKDVLTGQGYTVLEAANGREALEICETHPGRIHLLVSDLIMPEIGGLELARRMRKLNPSLSILHISGYSDTSPKLDVGALIQRPVTPSTLLAGVRQILDANEGGQELEVSG
jgi:CheY-like chemotaxis protein